ncbi:hypothetical protein ACFDR9_002223 [Janthinobacterium sp. CG_23.3]
MMAVPLPSLRFCVCILEPNPALSPHHGDAAGPPPRPSLRLLMVASLAGVRGALTLAGILTLPLLMPDGSRFPARDLVIFLAMGVILLSLLLASVALPLLTRALVFAPPPRRASEERIARVAAGEAAIRALERACAGQAAADPDKAVHAEAATLLIEAYRRRVACGEGNGDAAAQMRRLAKAERSLHRQALGAERDELYRRRLSGELDDDIHLRLLREIDLLEATLEH